MFAELGFRLEGPGELLRGGELSVVARGLGVFRQALAVLDRLQQIFGLGEGGEESFEVGLSRRERFGGLLCGRLARLALTGELGKVRVASDE